MIAGFSGKKGSGKDLSGMIWQALVDKPTAFDGMDTVTEKDVIYKVWDAPTFKTIKFADTLKDMICLLLGCTREELEDRDFKESPLPESWWYYNMMGQLRLRGSYKLASDNKMAEERYLIKTTPRLLLQLMGTECGRNILHPNLWVMSVMTKYTSSNYAPEGTPKGELCLWDKKPNWVITDMRFPNELVAVKNRDGVTIRVNREYKYGDLSNIENTIKGVFKEEHPSETALDDAVFDYFIENNGTIKDLVEKIKEILIKEKVI
jgi:hypothetical protein